MKWKKKIKYSIDNYNKILEQKIFKDNAKEIVKKYYDDLEFAIINSLNKLF